MLRSEHGLCNLGANSEVLTQAQPQNTPRDPRPSAN